MCDFAPARHLPLWPARQRRASRKDLQFAQIPHNAGVLPAVQNAKKEAEPALSRKRTHIETGVALFSKSARSGSVSERNCFIIEAEGGNGFLESAIFWIGCNSLYGVCELLSRCESR